MGESAKSWATIAGTVGGMAAAYGASVGSPVVAIACTVLAAACLLVVTSAARGWPPFTVEAEAVRAGRVLRPKLEQVSKDGRSLFNPPPDLLRNGLAYCRQIENWIARVARVFTDAGMPTEAARYDAGRVPTNAEQARAHLTRRHEVLTDFIGDLREQEGLKREGDY